MLIIKIIGNVRVLTFCLQYMDLWLLYMCDFYIYMMHWIVCWMCVNDYYLLFVAVKAQTEGKYDVIIIIQ